MPRYITKAALADLIVARHFNQDSAAQRSFSLNGARGGSTPDPALAAMLVEAADEGISRRTIEYAFRRRRNLDTVSKETS